MIRLGKGTLALLSEGEDRANIPLEKNIPEESPAAEATVLGVVRDVFSRASTKPFDLAAHLELVSDVDGYSISKAAEIHFYVEYRCENVLR